ncbi:hypothetical protein BpHYR1_051757, partial [Brachionus plicatilis]
NKSFLNKQITLNPIHVVISNEKINTFLSLKYQIFRLINENLPKMYLKRELNVNCGQMRQIIRPHK